MSAGVAPKAVAPVMEDTEKPLTVVNVGGAPAPADVNNCHEFPVATATGLPEAS